MGNILITMVIYMRENGQINKSMVKENINGANRVNGREMNSMANGMKTKNMVMGNTPHLMEIYIKANGKMECKPEEVLGLQVINFIQDIF